MRDSFASLLMLAFSPFSVHAGGPDEDHHNIYVQIGGYLHFSSREDYQGSPILVAVERSTVKDRYYGLALFNNSFDQFSQFLYVGREFSWQRVNEHIRFRLSLGVVHGYTDEFEDELPLNYNGFAPGLIPSVGYRRGRVGYDLALLANAGLMLSVGYKF